MNVKFSIKKFLLVLMFLCALLAVACKHTHEFGEWVVVKEATEVEEGLKERTCECGEKESQTIDKLAHTHNFGEWVVVKEATEQEEGLKEKTCSCGEKETEVIEKLAHEHKFGEWVVVLEPTEEAEGLKEKTCACGEKETETIEKLAHEHKFGEWVVVKEATETEEGSKERVCACGEKETEVIAKLEHVHKFENGSCACGEAHDCVYVDGKCECGKVEEVVITGTIELAADKVSGKVGDEITVTANVVLDGEGDASLVWLSSDESVATVDEFGVVTLVGAGTAEITASLAANIEVFATIEVSCVPGVDFIQLEANEEYWVGATEELFFFYEPEDVEAEFVWSSSDESICVVDNGVITTLKGGYVEITCATADGEVSQTVAFKVYNYVSEIKVTAEKTMAIQTKQRLIAELGPEPYKASAKFESSDTSILVVDSQGMVTAGNPGKATITVTASDGGDAKAVVEIEVTEPVVDAEITLADPAVDGIARGTEYQFNGMKFVVGYTAFPTLKQAVEVATNTVYVAAGAYEENITIDKTGFQIIGPNSGINPVQATRLPEAEIKGKISIGAELKNIVIKGLAFTGAGCVDTGNNVDGIEISYNNVYDTNAEPAAWQESRVQAEAVFDFWNDQATPANNIVVKYNKFSGVVETNVLFARNENVTVTNNAFLNFGRDAIRCEGGYNYGVWTFDKNVFKNDEVSGNNGIYFQSVSGIKEDKYQEIVITNNTFENIGIAENAPSIYNGALSMRTYQEKGLKVDVLYNTFKNCVNYLRFRNNGANADTFTANINYNAFYGVPSGVYHANCNGVGDTQTSNPPLANMDCNFFATLEGSPIVELSEYADKFLDLASYAACYATKDEYENALKGLLGIEFEYVVNPEWKDLEEGAKVEAEGFTWTFGTDAFASIDDCISTVDKDDIVIKVLAGNYDTELTIAKNGITLVGPNQDLNAQYENRNNEAVIANKININSGVTNFTLNGFELTGAAQILPQPDVNGINVKYNVINKTSADGVVRGPAEGNINNLDFSYNYSVGNTSYRIIHITIGLTGFTAVNNYIENASAYDFLNVGAANGYLAGDVLIKNNTYINSLQSFLYVGGVKGINAVIQGNYLGDIANTGLDFRNMREADAAASFDIQYNTFDNAGCGWCPIRIRTAGYAEGNTIAINVENNKFIESAYNEGGKPQFLENPSFSSQSDPFKTIYVIGKNYYEWKGEPFTEISGFNFCDAQISFEEAYASEDDMPEYVIENQVKPTGVQITNKVETMDAFTTHQIAVKLSPEDVTNKKVQYITSDSSVATVSTAGLVTAKSEGTCTITVQCVADKSIVDTMTITVNPKARIELRYEGNAALLIGESVDVAARVIGAEGAAQFKSSDETVATVDANGKVTAVKEGQVTITATCGELSAEVSFTVLKEEYDGILGELVAGNNGVLVNQVVKYIGSDDGSADYPHEIYGSANDFWFGQLPEVTRNMLSTTAPNYDGREMTSLEWIVVHDTAGSGSTSTAKANSGWCTNSGNTGSSWHYTIGNDGIYQQIEENMVAWHAGDGIDWAVANNLSANFYDTGVAYEGDRPEVTVGADRYFYINGKKTNVEIPAAASTTTPINTLGMVCYKGENGNYVIPTTWVSSGYGNPICARGGNIHSIGIETAVNMGSDVWLTWQYTAKFVAQLLVKHNLTPDRVWFHNNFSNKPCPRTMMTAGLVEDFLELVYCEYEVAKNYADYEIKFESHNTDIMDNTGRIVEAPEYTTNVSYTVTVTKDGQSESVTLNTLVIGKYN